MDELLRAWETTFGRSTLPFGVAEVLLDDQGRPYDFAYRYINAAAAALTGHVTEDLLGEEAYALWGGDPIWLDHFYEAAYKGRASEFEAPSEMLQQFFRAEVFPISEGLCGFTIHDVTDWILPAQRSMEKAAAGLFFYDMRYRQMLLTEQAREQSGVDSNYISLTEFVGLTFGSTLSDEVRQKMEAFLERREAFYQEGRLPNGRWLRMSLDQLTAPSDSPSAFWRISHARSWRRSAASSTSMSSTAWERRTSRCTWSIWRRRSLRYTGAARTRRRNSPWPVSRRAIIPPPWSATSTPSW